VADSVQNFNELDSIFSANVLLSHWVLAPDNFYLTDLPFYVIGRMLFGAQLWLLYGVPFVVYGLLLGGVARRGKPALWNISAALVVDYH
jgi:hypothetical protein